MTITAADIRNLRDAMSISLLDNPEKQYSISKDNYDLLVSLINVLSKDEKSIIFEFVKNYEIIKNYDRYIFDVLEKLNELHQSRVVLFPLWRIGQSSNKSGKSVLYEFSSISRVEFPDKFQIADDPFSSKVLNSGLPKYAVDDFVGSGEQFLGMVEEMRQKKHGVVINGVACVISLELGADRLCREGFDTVCSVKRKRAVADYLVDAGMDAEKCYEVYDAMESRLNPEPIDCRGRNKSEALVSLKRTPNNTLPVFWSVGRDKKWPAPFKRG